MKNKILNVFLVGSSLLGFYSTPLLSKDTQTSFEFSSFFSQINNNSNSTSSNLSFDFFNEFKLTSTKTTQNKSKASDFVSSFFDEFDKFQPTLSTIFQSTTQPVTTQNSFFDIFNGIGNSSTAMAQPQNPVPTQNSFFDIFNGIGNSSIVVAQPQNPVPTQNLFSTFSDIFDSKPVGSPVVNQNAPHSEIFERSLNNLNAASETSFDQFFYNFTQTSTNNNGVISENAAYKIETIDNSGKKTIFQEGPPELLNQSFSNFFDFTNKPLKPMTVTIPAIENSFSDFLNLQKISHQNILDQNQKMIDKQLSKSKYIILDSKIKLAMNTLLQKSEDQIKNIFTNNDQYRTLSMIWPTLNNDQKVENTIDFVFTTPQITSLTFSTFTPEELDMLKKKSVTFTQKNNIRLPDNLEEFTNNFKTFASSVFSKKDMDIF